MSNWVDRSILDDTTLTGPYDWHLTWDPAATLEVTANVGGGAAGDQPGVAPGLSLFTAMREQLGLELRATRAAIDAVIIDHAARPLPD